MKAVLAGAFDPFTAGHLDIARRALGIFGELIVAVAVQTGKNTAPLADRLNIARTSLEGLDNVTVVAFDGLLSDFLAANMPCLLVRGLRGVRDVEYERDLCRIYSDQCGVECVYIMADARTEHISSTAVRELAALGAELKGYAAQGAVEKIKKVYARKGR